MKGGWGVVNANDIDIDLKRNLFMTILLMYDFLFLCDKYVAIYKLQYENNWFGFSHWLFDLFS